jgi:hypothetical protein
MRGSTCGGRWRGRGARAVRPRPVQGIQPWKRPPRPAGGSHAGLRFRLPLPTPVDETGRVLPCRAQRAVLFNGRDHPETLWKAPAIPRHRVDPVSLRRLKVRADRLRDREGAWSLARFHGGILLGSGVSVSCEAIAGPGWNYVPASTHRPPSIRRRAPRKGGVGRRLSVPDR